MSNSVSQYVRFDKGMTAIVKAFAIIFMIILHSYVRGAYDKAISYDYFINSGIHGSFKICVGMFTFMVGYGYAFSKTKDWKYSIQHIKKLLTPYWTILFLFSFPVCLNYVLENDLITFIYSLFGITDGMDAIYLNYSWFVYFFIFAMIVMPFISRFIDKRPVRNTIITVIASLVIGVVFHEIPRFLAFFNIIVPRIAETSLPLALFNCILMVPLTVLGYLFAHERYYEKIRINCMPKGLLLLVCVCIMVLIFYMRSYTYSDHNPFNLDFFFAPLMIGAIAVLFSAFEWHPLRTVLMKVGEVSVYMWFFHALFFTKAVRWFYQPAITVFNDINVVEVWTIVLTFFASWLIKSIVDKLIGLVSKHHN